MLRLLNPRIAGEATTALTLRVEPGGWSYLLRVEGEPSPLAQSLPIRVHAVPPLSGQMPYPPLGVVRRAVACR